SGTYSCYAGVSDFFFQAEDGIRDRNVTGVQTCALPIYGDKGTQYPDDDCPAQHGRQIGQPQMARKTTAQRLHAMTYHTNQRIRRSEERRVGKEESTWRGRGEGTRRIVREIRTLRVETSV